MKHEAEGNHCKASCMGCRYESSKQALNSVQKIYSCSVSDLHQKLKKSFDDIPEAQKDFFAAEIIETLELARTYLGLFYKKQSNYYQYNSKLIEDGINLIIKGNEIIKKRSLLDNNGNENELVDFLKKIQQHNQDMNSNQVNWPKAKESGWKALGLIIFTLSFFSFFAAILIVSALLPVATPLWATALVMGTAAIAGVFGSTAGSIFGRSIYEKGESLSFAVTAQKEITQGYSKYYTLMFNAKDKSNPKGENNEVTLGNTVESKC